MIANVLFLDDMEWRHIEFAKIVDHMPNVYLSAVYTAAGAIELLDSGHFDQVFLDHDLDPMANGMAVVDHIMAMTHPPSQIVIHSCNTIAACRMAATLEEHPAGIWVRRLAFPELLNRLHQLINHDSMR